MVSIGKHVYLCQVKPLRIQRRKSVLSVVANLNEQKGEMIRLELFYGKDKF